MKFKEKIMVGNAWKFLIIVLIIYFVLLFVNFELFESSLIFFLGILKKIIPIFILVFILMSITNYFVTPKFVLKHMKKRGIKKWIFVIVGGILSTGAVYMWYPLLADLKSKGISYGLMACFLYNRAIKLPLLPVAVLYFGWKFVMILMVLMLLASLIQGIILNKLLD